MIYDLIIIGSGPAGITAAIYAKRANLNVLLIEANTPGGQIVNTDKIENYPGLITNGADLAINMFNHLNQLNVETEFSKVSNLSLNKNIKEIKLENDKTLKSKTVIIATGVRPRKLKIENEDKFTNNGISWCAICDGPFYKDKIVSVIGGGNSGAQAALNLSQIAKKVYLIQDYKKLTADNVTVDKINKNKNIEVFLNSKPLKFIGDNKLEKIELNIKGETKQLKTDGVFEYIGLEPKASFLSKLDITKNGYILTNDNMETKIEGVYAAGDCRYKKYRQIVTAASDGAIAALNIIDYLGK